MLQAAVLKKKYFYWGAVFQKRRAIILALVFCFSLAARYAEYYTFREFNSDKSRQLSGAYQLLNGKGVSLESYDLNTFQPSLNQLVEWPPAYSYFIASISYITGLNVYNASIVLDVICLTALWVIFLWLAALLNFSLVQQTLLFVLLAFAKTLFIKLYSVDSLGITLFLLAAAISINIFQKKNKKFSLPVLALLFVLVFLMVFLKYSLLPACFALGLSMLSYEGFRDRKFSKAGFYLLATGLLSIAILLLYNQLRTGHTTGLYNRHSSDVSHLNLGNLSLFNPFIVNAFIFLDVLYTRFNPRIIYFISQIVSAAILIWIVLNLARKIKTRQADYFSHLVLSTVLCVIGFLAALSVYYPKDDHLTYVWTYVIEFRYFAPAVFLIIFYLLKNLNFSVPKISWGFAVSAFVAASIFCAFLLGAYYFVSHNTAGSFENLYGKIFRVNDFVEKEKNDQTYFISLSDHSPTDSEATSLAAFSGTKVAVSYYQYFPDSAYSILFSKHKKLPKGKKVIVFIDKNEKLLDSVNLYNRHLVKENSYGEKFLIINN